MGSNEAAEMLSLVPWCSWFEWQTTRLQLFAADYDQQELGVQRVATWRMRGDCVPIAVNATADLVQLQLIQGQCSDRELELSLSTVILRTVNGLADTFRKGEYANSISTLATSIGLPMWMVDMRHEIAHNKMPTLPMLQMASDYLLKWLSENYWEKQGQYLTQLGLEASNQVREIRESMPSDSRWFTSERIRDFVIPLLVDGECYGTLAHDICLVPAQLTAASSKDEFLKMSSKVTPFLKRLQTKWDLFGACLFWNLAKRLVASTDEVFSAFALDWLDYLMSSKWLISLKNKDYSPALAFEEAGYCIDELYSACCALPAPPKHVAAFKTTLATHSLHESSSIKSSGQWTLNEEWTPCPLGTKMDPFSPSIHPDLRINSYTFVTIKETPIIDHSSIDFLRDLDKAYENGVIQSMKQRHLDNSNISISTSSSEAAGLSSTEALTIQGNLQIWSM